MIALAVAAALALQALPPCGSSSPYDEAWSVSSAAGSRILCREPAGARDQVARWYRLEHEGEVVWRHSLAGSAEQGAVSARGQAAVVLRPNAERQGLLLVLVDPQGKVAIERELDPAAFLDHHECGSTPIVENPVEAVLVSDAAGVALVRRRNETYQRFALDDGRELEPRRLPERMWSRPLGAAFLDAVAIEETPFFVAHLLAVEDGVLRSTYALIEADLDHQTHVVVDRGASSAEERFHEVLDGFRRGTATLRAEGVAGFSVREPAGWVRYRVVSETPWKHAIVREGPAAGEGGR